MNQYKGLFTFDVDNHRYVPVEQADGLISDMNYNPEPKEEPKEYWFIDSCGGINKQEADILGANRREIGNYFETKEEAEKAVEKLKAFKRLRDKGFHFESWWGGSKDISFWVDTEIDVDMQDDLDLLFGDKE